MGLSRYSKRLKRLEERASASTGSRSPRYLEAYFRALQNLEREEAGLPPLPYSEVDRREDEEFLRETLPVYMASPGWQSEQAQRILIEWKKHTMHSLENGA